RRYARNADAAIPPISAIDSHHGMGYAKCMTSCQPPAASCPNDHWPLTTGRWMLAASLFLLRRQCLEVTVDLLLVFGRRFVLDASGQAILRLLRLQLFRQRGLDPIEPRRRLLAHVFPFREVLLERLGAGRRQGHALTGEGEAGASAREVRIVAAHLVQKIFGFLEAACVFVAQARQLDAA